MRCPLAVAVEDHPSIKKVCEGEKRERRSGVFEALRDKIENEFRHGKRMIV